MPGVMRKPQRKSILSHLISKLLGVGAGHSRFLPCLFRSRSALIAENLFLRKQLAFYREREIKPRRLTDAARVCLLVWSRLFNWREALLVVKPETLVVWHRKGFRLFWKWKSKGGRPRLPRNIRCLIAEMAAENPTWGEERVADELALKLGIYVSPRTVRPYWPEEPLRSGPRSARPQHWRTFVRNHARAIVACDFLMVVTSQFQLLYVLAVMEIGSRKDRALQRHAPPNRNLDDTAITGSHPQRPRIQVPDSRPRQHLLPDPGPTGRGAGLASAANAGTCPQSQCLLRAAGRHDAAGML
jgi:hypothetical protein